MWYHQYPWFLGDNTYGNTNFPYGNRPKRDWNDLFLRRVKVDNNWRKSKFKQRRLPDVHNLAVAAVQCDETVLVTGSYDESIKVWDIQKGVCVGILNGTGWVS